MTDMNKLLRFVSFLAIALSIIACKKETTSSGGGVVTPPSTTEPGVYSGTKLAISTGMSLVKPIVELGPDSVFSSSNFGSTLVTAIPAGFEDKITSFYLPKGYMLVMAANADGTGESITVMAIDSAVKANLPSRLLNTISYIRYKRFTGQVKKGVCVTEDNKIQAFGSGWFYSWGPTKPVFPNQQFVPMIWGKTGATDANVKMLAERNDIDHLLSFNEPDNSSQSNIPVDTAIARYKVMQRTGLRLVSPVTTQDQAFGIGKWLTNFMTIAQNQRMRIDCIAVHWYDWGNQTNNAATDSLTAEKVFGRFKTYMENVHSAYPDKPIWLTEYNANVNRKSQVVQMYFMRLSSEWLNDQPWVERYSFFFEADQPPLNPDNSLTTIGAYWKDLRTTSSYSTGNQIGDATLIR